MTAEAAKPAVAEGINGEPLIGPACFDTAFRHDVAELNGTRLHFVTGGSGPAVVLLHGWPFTWYEWKLLAPRLAVARTVIMPDLRGMGDSAKPAEGYSKTEIAADIRALVRHLGHDRTAVVGFDLGGMVAFAYAMQYPDATTHVVMGEHVLPGFGLEEATRIDTDGLWHFGFHAQPIAAKLVEGREQLYIGAMLDTTTAKPGGWEPMTRDTFLAAHSAPGAVRAGFAHYATLVEDGRENRALVERRGKLTAPLLVLGGEKSLGDKLCQAAPEFALNWQCKVVADAGHSIQTDQPAALAELLLKFFQTPG